MVANGQVAEAISPADAVRERLDDPRVAEALTTLLDHADLLAVLVGGLDGLVRRGDDIADNLTSAIGELKGAEAQFPGAAALKDVNLTDVANGLATLTGALVRLTPSINTLVNSSLTDERGAEVLAAFGDAVVSARSSAPAPPPGLRGLWKTLRSASKDPDVGRGVVYLVEVARIFGRKV